MSIAIAPGYLVRRVSEAPTIPCPCGQSTRLMTRADTPACNFHVTFIQDSVRHYHKECTEVYYILAGDGKMELNADVIDVSPGRHGVHRAEHAAPPVECGGRAGRLSLGCRR